MSLAFRCDRCKDFGAGSPRKVKYASREYELCPKCSTEMNRFLNGAEVVKEVEEGIDTSPIDKTQTIDYEIEYLIYESTNPHDCETIYSCPYCGKKISSWTLYHQERENRESPNRSLNCQIVSHHAFYSVHTHRIRK